jgi:hypothetical protein
MTASPYPHGLSFFNSCLKSFKRFSHSADTLAADDRVVFLEWVQRRLRRTRCYRRVLSCSERATLELTLALAKKGLVKIVSFELLNAIGLILMKVRDVALRFCDVLAEEGREMLVDVCRVAASWGNGSALMWLRDRGFAIYLALIKKSTEMLWAAG